MKDYAKQNYIKRSRAERYFVRFFWLVVVLIIIAGAWSILTIDYSAPVWVDLP